LAGRVKRKDHENLTDSNVEKVIKALSDIPPISKKEACKRLNITYNTTRLQKIIDEFKEQKALDKRLREANRGKPAQEHEIKYAIEQYLAGTPIADIANSLYRNGSFVKNIINEVGVPTRGVGEDYTNYSPLPDRCVADKFDINEIAWSSKYSAPCVIDKEMPKPTIDGEAKLYRIFVFEPYEEPKERYVRNFGQSGFYAHQPAYELGKLEHLKQYGVDIHKRT
jgi:hypothetical protein